MTITTRSSDNSAAPVTAAHAQVIVLEGMPGAGKTTLADALTRTGAHVLGEYTSASGTTLLTSAHPPVADDGAHQANWLRKAALARRALAYGTPVYCDRDWLSSLAFAHSIDDAALLRNRADWALACLAAGTLLLPSTYAIFQVDVATSLRRREDRLRPSHPWSRPTPLRRLQRFYTDPADAVASMRPALAAALSNADMMHVCGHSHLEKTLRLLHHLTDPE